MTKRFFITVLISILIWQKASATTYYFHPRLGNDTNSGKSLEQAFQSLAKVKDISLQAGDTIYLASGEVFKGTLILENTNGKTNLPIRIESYSWTANTKDAKAMIDAEGFHNCVLIENSSFIQVKNLSLKADGPGQAEKTGAMRVGVLINNTTPNKNEGIVLDNLNISDVFFEPKGTTRNAEEVKSANGTQKYGWGIRLICTNAKGSVENVKILNCQVENVSHTGIKLTGTAQNIRNILIKGNKVLRVGGPGIQMSEVRFVHVVNNEVSYSGSTKDSRHWGRGSGLWTWGASNVLIEHNSFTNANGPGDSAGAHIDYNCDNVVLQYNFSANNAGGFCEVLGNNYNCAYRYNISVNDGHRIKGKNGAFQEGKLFWLSGYQGTEKPRKGPVNTYFYNNTIYVSYEQTSKIAIDNTSHGVLIANNIFYIKGNSQSVLGDQYKPDSNNEGHIDRTYFINNVFLRADNWPNDALISDESPLIGNPDFKNAGGLSPQDYIPTNKKLVAKGIPIPLIEEDWLGLMNGLNPEKDFLGTPINGKPCIGAIKIE
jgi:hypothetical protein